MLIGLSKVSYEHNPMDVTYFSHLGKKKDVSVVLRLVIWGFEEWSRSYFIFMGLKDNINEMSSSTPGVQKACNY